MATVLVTAGTGMLGAQLVPELLGRGHAVRVLSRSAAPGRLPEGAQAVRGDVRTGEGLHEAVAGADTVIHAATNPARRARATEVDGTRHMLDAARDAGVPNFVYVSIVGVGNHRLPYYKAKWAAEQIVEGGAGGWTILRATQFHGLINVFFRQGVFAATRRMAFQPVDAGEVSARLAELVEEGPCGRAPDFGGPEVLTVRELARIREEVSGRRTRVVPLPRLAFLHDFDDGRHLAPDHKRGQVTWRDWLSRRTS